MPCLPRWGRAHHEHPQRNRIGNCHHRGSARSSEPSSERPPMELPSPRRRGKLPPSAFREGPTHGRSGGKGGGQESQDSQPQNQGRHRRHRSLSCGWRHLVLHGRAGRWQETVLDLGNDVKKRLVLIPAGKFMMGSPATEVGRSGNEGPRHEVTISKPFYMGVFEVTQSGFVAGSGWFGSRAMCF